MKLFYATTRSGTVLINRYRKINREIKLQKREKVPQSWLAGTPSRTEPIQKQSEEGDRVKGVIVVAWEEEEEKGTISLL